MSLISRTAYQDGATVTAAGQNSNEDAIFNDYNGNIDNTNIAASAAIADTKLAQITTPSKVSGAAITALASVPSGAGVLPIANIATGTPTGSKFVRDDGTLQVPSQTISAGMVINMTCTETGSVNTGTTIMPYDNSIPTSSEGDEYMTHSHTPADSANTLYIDVIFYGTSSANGDMVAALYQDAGASAIAAGYFTNGTANFTGPITFRHKMTAGTTSAITFRVRAGNGSPGTTTFNGASGTRLMGGVSSSSITVTEVKV